MTRIELDVTVENGIYKIDGFEEYDFIDGVEYVLNSPEDIYLTWRNKTTSHDVTGTLNNATVIDLWNLTDHNHHKYASDNLLYYSQQCPLFVEQHTQIGLLYKKQDGKTIDTNALISSNLNDRIIDVNNFLINSTIEELINVVPRDYSADEFTSFPVQLSNQTNTYVWQDDLKYVALIVDGKRVTTDYSIQWRTDGFSRLTFKNPLSGEARVKTDLMHYATGNGSTRVTFMMRPDDERVFYINNANRSNNDYRCRGRASAENRAFIRQMFDDWLLSKYPTLYEVLLSYINSQNVNHEAQSFLRNLIAYKDIDLTTDSLVKRILSTIFTPFDSVLADRRLVYKRLNDFFKNKGDSQSYTWLSQVLFNKPSTIDRFSDRVLTLDRSEWNEETVITIGVDDINAMNTTEIRTELGAASNDLNDVAQSLVGFVVEGKHSKTVALINSVEEVEIDIQRFWRVSVIVKSGEFLQDEAIYIKNIKSLVAINSAARLETEIAIIDVKINDGGTGYKIGQDVYSTSHSGLNFIGSVSDVGHKGEIKHIKIDDAGWFYRNYQDPEIKVVDDIYYAPIPYTLSISQQAFRPFVAQHIVYQNDKAVPVTLTGTVFDINGIQISDPFVSFAPIAAIEYRGVYSYILSTTNGVNVHSRFNSITSVNLSNPTPIRAIDVHNSNVLICYDDRYRIIDYEELISGNPTLSFTDITYDATQVGTVTGCMYNDKEILIFTNTPSMYRYVGNAFAGSQATASSYISAETKVDENGIFTRIFYDGTNSWTQQYWPRGKKLADMESITGRVLKYRNGYTTADHTLSSSSLFRDNDRFQTFSFGINLDVSTDQYMKTYDKMINPAGYKIRGVKKSLDASADIRTSTVASIA